MNMNVYDPNCACIGCDIYRKTAPPLQFVTPYAAHVSWRLWVLPQAIDPAKWARDYAAAARGPQLMVVGDTGALVSPFDSARCYCPACIGVRADASP